jgi:hypothetical protein
MTTFTEIVAAVVVQSSALALSHFGVTMDPAQVDRMSSAPVERVIARTPSQQRRTLKLTACPQARQPAHVVKV